MAITENRLGFSRQHYNETVGSYNGSIATIPNVLIPRPCGFRQEPSVELDVPAKVPHGEPGAGGVIRALTFTVAAGITVSARRQVSRPVSRCSCVAGEPNCAP